MSFAAAAHVLSDILVAENAALAAMDVPAAIALVPAKQAATQALIAAQMAEPQPVHPGLREATDRLRALAATNKTLLERAMLAQDRILGCIARALPRAVTQGGRYGACGANVAQARLPPVALSARA